MKKLEILKPLMPMDKESVIVWHKLAPNEIINEHTHEDFDEFVLIDNGDFTTILNGKKEMLSLKDKEIIVYFPATRKHGLINGPKEIEYFVLRVKK